MMAGQVPTVVVELTPAGRAAVAVIVVDGPNALAAVQEFFVPATPGRDGDPTIGRIMLGRWGGDQGEELIVCRRGERQVEIHCHGGFAAAPAIVEQLAGVGCKKMDWREWMRSSRACPASVGASASRRDAATWAAFAALAEATTARTAAVLLDQYHGALSAAIEDAQAALAVADTARAAQIIDGILQFRELGRHLTTPWRVVIVGAPNVGKSSLINAIAGYQRAIVSPHPGTTRDVVTITTAINGWPVQIADTAGLRETGDELELAGVALAWAEMERAELVIVVADATGEFDHAKGIVDRLAPTVRVIVAVNKIDLVDGGLPSAAAGALALARGAVQFESCKVQRVSALTGEGIAKLLVAIERSLAPVAPPAGAAVPFTPSQIAGLEAARLAIEGSDPSAADVALAAVLSSGVDACQ
jgi:tRNA modification GTPase